jgi:hypothetical protein
MSTGKTVAILGTAAVAVGVSVYFYKKKTTVKEE